jgi:hypothetical protein
VRSQTARDGLADTATRAGDHSDLACKLEIDL